jgi:hypothetical protein
MDDTRASSIKTISYIVILVWFFIVGGAFGINYSNVTKNHNDLAFQTARALFQQIVLSRAWNSGHGGVYVPVTEKNRPNPYLIDPLRDLEATQGVTLTKINPAYMTRQIAEIASQKNGVQFHITSLKLIRPENKPTDWEKSWLESFEKGIREQGEFVQQGAETSFRYMAPLVTERSCLKCHAKQGYKVGDIRGGISVTLPSFPKADYFPLIFGYGIATVLGSLIIFIAGHMLDNKERKQQELIKDLQDALTEIETLQGIVPICSFCKKIRDDEGFWNQVESYVSKHTKAEFSHGICPECKTKQYPELYGEDED